MKESSNRLLAPGVGVILDLCVCCRCESLGCDGQLLSMAVLDKCGVYNGDRSIRYLGMKNPAGILSVFIFLKDSTKLAWYQQDLSMSDSLYKRKLTCKLYRYTVLVLFVPSPYGISGQFLKVNIECCSMAIMSP